jgi:transcriptional regulator with XRE-family HTH domain
MPLPERVHQLRNEHGWSQAQLAEHVGADGRPDQPLRALEDDALGRHPRPPRRSPRRVLRLPTHRRRPRRPFRSADRHLGERFAALEELPPEDLASLLNHLDALIAKNRLKAIAGDVG